MATSYTSFHHILEKQSQAKTPKTLLDTLSSPTWNPKDETPPFTEIFGELHFKESDNNRSGSCLRKASIIFEPALDNSKSLQLCTEGLGSESCYDVEDEKVLNDVKSDECNEESRSSNEIVLIERGREYPPAMTRMSFKTYREEGRLVLEEIRIPRRQILKATRKDGRLKLKLVQPQEEEEEYEEIKFPLCFD